MMPVIRLSDHTWDRLKAHARPFEDKPEDIVNLALDALDEKIGVKAQSPRPLPNAVKPKSGKKLPQKEFRIPLMETVAELGGSAVTSDIRPIMEDKMKARLGAADYEPVSSGDPRWWNAICWERNDLIKEGLFVKDSERGVWKLSQKGRLFLSKSELERG